MPRSAPRCRRAAGCGDELRPGRLPGALATVPVRATEAARARAELAERLRGRREEIEEAVLTRIHGIADPQEVSEPEYVEGLRAAVTAALEHGLQAIVGQGEPPIPLRLLSQARLAARNEVSLDTILRRYFAGYSLLGYLVVEEAGRGGLMGAEELKRMLATLAGAFDRLIVAVTEEHGREVGNPPVGIEERRVQRVKRLLTGEQVDPAEIAYSMEGHHVGIAIAGDPDPRGLREIAESLDVCLLVVKPEEQQAWAWLGGREEPDPGEALQRLAGRLGPAFALGVGEPGEGLPGWRLTHRQALAALTVATRQRGAAYYAEVALVASALQDELLSTSLRRLYIEPLQGERDGGKTLVATAWAYLRGDRNRTSAAAILGVSARTIGYRLQRIEELVGRPLPAAMTDIEVALGVEELKSALGDS